MWAETHTAGIPTSTPVLQSKRMAVDVGAKERSGAVESEPGSSGKARQLLMLPLQNLHLNVQHSGYSPGSYLSALPAYSEQHLGTFGRNPKEVQEVGLARSSLYSP